MALLAHETIADAAKASGVAPRTAFRWLQEPAFQTAYRAARRQIVEHSLSVLQRATSEAVETLRRNLHGVQPAVQVSAARSILEFGIRAVEVDDLSERVEQIESALESQQDGGRKPWGRQYA